MVLVDPKGGKGLSPCGVTEHGARGPQGWQRSVTLWCLLEAAYVCHPRLVGSGSTGVDSADMAVTPNTWTVTVSGGSAGAQHCHPISQVNSQALSCIETVGQEGTPPWEDPRLPTNQDSLPSFSALT